MFSIPRRKVTSALVPSFIVLICFFVLSCQKELIQDVFIVTEMPPDLAVKVNSSVSGFVTDESDVAVSGAAVKVGSMNTTTDKFGYFQVNNVQVIQTAAIVSVAKPGYFNGIKTYIATNNKAAFFRIKLIPKSTAGSVDAAVGGVVTTSTGLTVNFPADAFVVASSNASYSGQVSIAAQWIDPTAEDVNRKMPGDLRGLDTFGFIKSLTTYGMAAIELSGSGGELLQLAPGIKASVTFPLPASISATAPGTIPLWYFDEAIGLWKQQGIAVKTGAGYTGEVSHFSFWNCDVPANYIHFDCTVLDATGKPIKNASVKISVVNNTYDSRSGYTDSSGYVGGLIPSSSKVLLEVFSDHSCPTAVYSQTILTSTESISLGSISIAASMSATITGNVIDCNGAAVTNGYAIMEKDGMNFHVAVNSTGTFSITTIICNTSTIVKLIAQNNSTLQAGNESTLTLNAGLNAAGTLTACGTNIEQFLNYTVNGTDYSILSPNSFGQEIDNQSVPQVIHLFGFIDSTGSNRSVHLTFTQTGIGVGSTQNLTVFSTGQISDSTLISSPIAVNITEYGAVGQYIAGNFAGTVIGAPPANTPYLITCNFRIKRKQ
jgi:hypothetical protein